jgi:hypothetical protein
MALHTGSSKLGLALKTLRLRWEETKEQWKDPVSQAFEANQMTPLERQILATLRAIDRLAQVIDQARSECGEREFDHD